MNRRIMSFLITALFIMMLAFGGCGGGGDGDSGEVTPLPPEVPPIVDGNWMEVADTSWYSEDQNIFTISTAEQLAGFAKVVSSETDFSGKTIKLANDISLLGKEWTPITGVYRYSPMPEGYEGFRGTFDGGGYTISGMTITEKMTNSSNSMGLFAFTSGATIKNLKMTNIYINSNHWSSSVGGIIGSGNYGETLTGCEADGSIFVSSSSSNVGGIMGDIGGGGIVSDCTSDISIIVSSDYYSVGGIVGHMSFSTITNCISNSEISVNYSSSPYPGYYNIGGIAGYSETPSSDYISVMTNCTSNGKISVTPITTDIYAGGVIGELYIEKNIAGEIIALPQITGNTYNKAVTGQQWGIGFDHRIEQPSDNGAAPFE